MNTIDLTDRLDCAIDAVLAVRLALGGPSGLPLPEEALDIALSRHEGFQEARRGFVAALEGLRCAGVATEPIFTVEAAAHTMVAQAAVAGWTMGITARGGPA